MLKLPPAHLREGGSYGGGYGDTAARQQLRRRAKRIAARHGVELDSDWPMPELGLACMVMRAGPGIAIAHLLEQLNADSDVAWAQPVQAFGTLARPQADPLLPAQPAAKAWRLAELHRHVTGKGVLIAVIDSGIDAGHPDLKGRIAATRDVTRLPDGKAEIHGTSVAGIIAANARDGIGIAGVAPGARLLGLRACIETNSTSGAQCDTLSLARALHQAVEKRAGVINLSLSGPPDRLLATLIARAQERGARIVAAVRPQPARSSFPASLPAVIAVASSPGPSALAAPGRDVPTTRPGGLWHLVSGSSYSVAHVSGLVALMMQANGGTGSDSLTIVQSNGWVDACRTVLGTAGCRPAAALSSRTRPMP